MKPIPSVLALDLEDVTDNYGSGEYEYEEDTDTFLPLTYLTYEPG